MTTADEQVWLLKEAVLLAHARSLAQHGGPQGLRDDGMLESALARPQQLYAYGDPPPDLAAMAAAYAFGIAKNHPFVDGNKRTSLIALGGFLRINGFRLTADQVAAYQAIIALAEGSMTEKMLAAWVRQHMEPR